MITWHPSHFTTDSGGTPLHWRWPFFFLRCLGLDSPVAQLSHQRFSDWILSIPCPIYPSSLHPLLFHPYPTHQMSLLPILLSPSPYLSISLSLFLRSLPLLWRSGTMQSQRACPCLITLIKHPVRWNDLAPHNPLNTLRISPSLPSCCSAGLCLSRFPQRPSPVGTGLRFAAECEAQS